MHERHQGESAPGTPVLDTERWFVDRGVPHFVESDTEGSILDVWTRALPLLVAAYVLLGLNALDLQNWTLGENLATAGVVVLMLVATWATSNRLRGHATFARPTDIDAPELVLFVLGPTLPVLAFGQFGDAVETAISAILLLTAVYLWSSYGIGPLLRWAVRHSIDQLNALGPLVARALPLLLLFNTFLFVNAEVWEVAGTLNGPAYAIVVLTFFVLGAGFAISRAPRFVRSQNQFPSWEDAVEAAAGTPAEQLVATAAPRPGTAPSPGNAGATGVDEPLRLRQRVNITLVVLFGQAIQVTLVVAVLIGFFVFFGFMAITSETMLRWTSLDELSVWAEASFGGRTLVLSESLVRVSAFLGAFSGMYFTVLSATDESYRAELDDNVGSDVRQALAARVIYRVARRTGTVTSP